MKRWIVEIFPFVPGIWTSVAGLEAVMQAFILVPELYEEFIAKRA